MFECARQNSVLARETDGPTTIKRKRVWVIGCALGASAFWPAWTLAQEVRDVYYQEDQVVRINTGLGIATQIEISSQEQIKDYGTGFSDGWELVRRDNVFYIRPKNVDVDTNMYIRTNMRSYLLDLRVVATKWKTLEEAKKAGVHYKVRYVYENKPGVSPPPPPPSPSPSPGGDFHRKYDYSTVLERSTIIPEQVYDDHKFTYIHLSPLASFPAVFGRNERHGEEFLVNTKSEKNVMTVLGVYPYLVLRLGSDVVGLRRNP